MNNTSPTPGTKPPEKKSERDRLIAELWGPVLQRQMNSKPIIKPSFNDKFAELRAKARLPWWTRLMMFIKGVIPMSSIGE